MESKQETVYLSNEDCEKRIRSFNSRKTTLIILSVILLPILAALAVFAYYGTSETTTIDESQNKVVIFANGNLSETQINEIFLILDNSEYTEEVVFKDSETAWSEWKTKNPASSDIHEQMEHNPMPNTFIVTINDLEQIPAAVYEFEKIPNVNQVKAPYNFHEFNESFTME
jgi:cell division protein FtsX